jgi:chromosome segregation ATPase
MPNLSFRWRSRPAAAALERNVDELRTVIIQLRRDLTNKEGYAGRLEVLLRARTERMDELANTIATLREQNRRLNEEADHLAEMVRMSPGDAP